MNDFNIENPFYTYDGSFDGFLTAVHTAVYARKTPKGIAPEKSLQLSFDSHYINVDTDSEKAAAVMRAMREKIGERGSKRLYYTFLSSNNEKDIIIYRYLMLGFKNGSIVNHALTNETVLSASKLAENVSRETEKFRQFVRFSLMENGVMYAKFAPQNNILSLLTPFFAKRLSTIPFVLHDVTHNLCSVYNRNDWIIISSDELKAPDLTEDERTVRRLWKTFFDTISIKERENPRLQKQMMPAKYFKHEWTL